MFVRSIYLLAALACLALPGCGTNKVCDRTEPYQTSRTGGELKVPDGLSTPPAGRDYRIPDVAPGRSVRGPCSDAPPRQTVVTPPAPKNVRPPEPDADGNLPLPDSSAPPPVAPPAAPAAPATGAAAQPDAVPAAASAAAASAVPAAVAAGAKAAAASGPAVATAAGADGDMLADTRRALDGWLAAWRAGNAADYLGYYSDRFEPPIPGESLETWRQQRRNLFAEKGAVDVRLDRITIVETRPGVMRARFIQELHREDGQINALIKALEFSRQDGRMLIDRELVLQIL